MGLELPKATQRNPTGVTALIDGDVVVYSCGFAAQKNIHYVTLRGWRRHTASFQYKKELNQWVEDNGLSDTDYTVTTDIEAEPVENALHSVKIFLEGVMESTDAEHCKIFLTGKNNFRDEVATILPYKGNRHELHKPVHYEAIRDYLINTWGAVIVDGMEADDMMAIEQTKGNEKTVICSTDKDLRMVAGWHFNWNRDESPVWVSKSQGMKWFYTQLLTGDRVDNIQGIPGVGPKTAEKILADCETEEDMYWAAVCTYEESYDKPYDALIENARLLWMLREVGKMWEAPA